MNTRWKKAAAAGLCVCLALSAFTGCSKDKGFDTKAAAITVNDDTVSAGVLKFATHHLQAQYESMYASFGYTGIINQDIYGTGTTLGESLKDQMVEQMTHIILAEQHMGDYGVSISEQQKAEMAETAAKFLADNDKEVLEKISADQETVERYLELLTVQSMMQKAMGDEVDTEVSDEEAAQRKITYALFSSETEAETEEESETEAVEAASEAQSDGVVLIDEEMNVPAETAVGEEAETAALLENDTTKTQSADETEAGTEEAGETEGDGASLEAETGISEDAEPAMTEEDGAEAEPAMTEEDATEAESETETEDPAVAAAKRHAAAEAELLISKIQLGEDFETAAKAIDENVTFSTMTFGEGDADYRAELLEATDGLADGTLVDYPVETDEGCYVVRLDTQLDREATDAEKETIVEERKADHIEELYTEWEEAAEISTDSDVLAQIDFDFSLTLATEASTEAPAEASTETPAEDAVEASTEAPAEDAAGAEMEEVTEAAAAETAQEAVTEAEEPAVQTEMAEEATEIGESEAATE